MNQIAGYTQRIMDSLSSRGEAVVRFHITHAMGSYERRKAESRARSRIVNAASRLGVRVSTSVEVDEHGPLIRGRVL